MASQEPRRLHCCVMRWSSSFNMFTRPALFRPVKVTRDFSAIYRKEADPWNIGNADSERYDLYYCLVEKYVSSHLSILDIGCGFGSFLSRFQNAFQQTTGLEISKEAIAQGQVRYPGIDFVCASAANIGTALRGKYDAVIFSDVIYYLNDQDKHQSLEWIATHLCESGIALIAGWCPGGQYLEIAELRALVKQHFSIV